MECPRSSPWAGVSHTGSTPTRSRTASAMKSKGCFTSWTTPPKDGSSSENSSIPNRTQTLMALTTKFQPRARECPENPRPRSPRTRNPALVPEDAPEDAPRTPRPRGRPREPDDAPEDAPEDAPKNPKRESRSHPGRTQLPPKPNANDSDNTTRRVLIENPVGNVIGTVMWVEDTNTVWVIRY